MKLVGIKHDHGVFIADEDRMYKSSSYTSPFQFNPEKTLVNGKPPKKTFHTKFLAIEEDPVRIQQYISHPNINYRYELLDKSMESEKIPAVLMRDEVESEDYVWKKEYAVYRSLYSNCISDEQPDTLEDVEFEYECIMEVKNLEESDGFSYDVQKTKWEHEGTRKLTEEEASHQLMDLIVFPPVVLKSRPHKLSSEQTYKIVREYIKQNINPEVAEITSDYDFCFTVNKKIPLTEVEEFTVDVNFWHNAFSKSNRKRKSKYEKRYRKERLVEIFNMAPKEYKEYPVIKGFLGDNEKHLKQVIDDYCSELIKFINEPVEDCPHCKGLGVTFSKKFVKE